jgi:chromosome segregation protein
MLKSLELFGFKSFADRTRFDFAPGVTCVVGPNGSGKSNVVDSIKWILGDQSPKSLRGKEMTDVIFNGSGSRKPAALAEALLNFDNTRRVLAIDADEVQVGRRIYRSGESEYLINRVPARLKDIRDLFLGSGAGNSAYSIIEQGRVDQLLQATNVARRSVFEEAAGISRFKSRKVDAQRKLERVAQNLLRLTDIVSEVETQLNALRTQAAKAAKFREYTQELRTLRIGSTADDYRVLGARLETVELARRGVSTEIEQATAEAQDCDAQQAAAESQLAESEDRLRAAERRAAENREAIAGFEATLRHQTTRRQELEADYQRLDKQQTDLADRAQAVAGELEQTVDDLQKFADDVEIRQGALAAAETTIREISDRATLARAALDSQRSALLESVRRLSALGSRAHSLEAQRQAVLATYEDARSRQESLDRDIAGRRQNVAARAAEVESAEARHTGLRSELRALRNRRGELHGQQAAARQNLADLREQRGSLQARRGMLEEFERRQEGLGVGVKEILALAKEASGPPWDRVLGHVVDLLEVELENAALLEVALAGRAQLIVLEDGRPLVDYLGQPHARFGGRVGFLAVGMSGGEIEKSPGWGRAARATGVDLSGRPGVIGRADRLVRAASGIHHLPELLLADTWIVSELAVAWQLAAATGNACRFVTLQGELLETNGTLYVGPLRGEAELVSRKSELRGLKTEAARLERQIADDESTLERFAAEEQELARLEQQLQFDLDLDAHSLSELRTSLTGNELDLERALRHEADAEAVLERAATDLEQIEPEWETARQEVTNLDAVQYALQTSIDQGERDLAADEARLHELQNLFAAEERDLARFEERLANLQNARTRLDQERLQRDLHREEAQRRFQVLAAKRDQIEVEILNTQSVLDELAREKDRMTAEVAQLQKDRDFARSRRGDLAERELAIRHRVRELQDRQHAFDMQTTECRHQITNLEERLRDEFQVELTEVAAAGATALQRPGNEENGAAAAQETTSDTAEGEAATIAVEAVLQSTSAAEARARLEEQIQKLRRKIKQLGHVNADSLKELDELEARFTRLSGQLQDLVEAKETLEEIIRRINAESKRMFVETFAQIRANFQELFRKLFGGGEGDILLENPEDVLECGIDVVARPPGKELRSISLLSGGEKTMTAVALLLAIFKSKPSPFCILDEVDAALDEANVNRYLGIVKEFQQWTQFIVITHHKRTMTGADVLYGVTMEEAGVSKRMSVRFEDISEDGHFKTPGVTPAAMEATTAA